MITTEKAFDMLPFVAGIVENTDVMNKIKEIRGKKNKKDVEQTGLEIVLYIVKNSAKCKDDFFGLLAVVADCSLDEAKEIPLNRSVELLKEVFTDKELMDFFGSAV